MKRCCTCKQNKDTSEFNISIRRKDGLDVRCKVCSKKYSREYARKRKQADPNYDVDRTLLARYGITQEEKNSMLLAQDGKCYICKRDIDGHKVYVDHNHTTGKVRKLLCPSCNCLIGLALESEDILNTCINYLKEHKE